ncbi:Uncharacterised protein [Salmonella enterica subsp. enterica]|nr:Uncharacterised protein [Salmonella enterica subsp. enterica]
MREFRQLVTDNKIHAVHNEFCVRNMKQLQYRTVRTYAFQTRHIPRDQRHHHKNGTQVKDGNSPDNRIGGAYDMFIRAYRIPRQQ